MQDSTTTIECTACHKKNRVPLARLGDKPKCGACGSVLPTIGAPLTVTDDDFDTVLSSSPVPVIVDFWAPWCGPCRMIGPVLEQIARERPHDVLIAKLNVDDNPNTASRFRVRSIPMLVAFKNSKALDTQIGALPPAALRDWVDRIVNTSKPS